MKTTENMLVSRAMEMWRESEYAVSVTDFFSPGDKLQIYHELITRIGCGISRCFFWGGCRGAERCTAVFLPEWLAPEDAPGHRLIPDAARTDFFASFLQEHPETEIPITALRIRGSGFRTLTHRDFMGSVLALGVDRSVIGDIAVVSESEALVMVHRKIAPFLLSELTKIGRDGVKTEEVVLPPTFELPRRFEELTIVVSSPRLDGVVKALTGKSREAAAELVRQGLVELNYSPEADVADEVKEDDVISVRGLGKFIVGEVAGTTRSGRIRMACRKYS